MRPTQPFRRRLLLLCTLGAVLAGAPAPHVVAQEAGAELKLSVAVGPVLPLGKAAARWGELLAEPGEGAIAVKLHPGASLAERDPGREFAALKEARADLAAGSALQWSLQVPALGVFALPWIAPEDAQLAAMARDAGLRELLRARVAAAGAHLVALAPLGYREIANRVRPIRAPEDVAGLRLRATASPLLQDVLRALGAVPQSLPFVEAQAAFAAGSLDGQEGLPSALAAARVVVRGQRHVTDLGGIGDAMVFAVRSAVWSAWSPAQRERAQAAAERAIAETKALEAEQAALRQLAARGASVLRLTGAGQQAFRTAAREADVRWRAT
ncbi:MAG: TRAP transporter substrate-binding protein DctP, partial [Betaproteobacteria bacterium]|nr:TRAP transporter substrate-binding protein DctP [Betaproteobacteria bacterium]